MNQSPEGSVGAMANPYAAPGSAPGAMAAGAGYEFTAEENATIAKMAGAMRFVGVVTMLLGALLLVVAAVSALGANAQVGNVIGHAIDGLIQLLYGIWTLNAAGEFRRVVSTQGNDVQHVMVALESLRKYFGLVRVMIIIGIVLMVLGFVAFLMMRQGAPI